MSDDLPTQEDLADLRAGCPRSLVARPPRPFAVATQLAAEVTQDMPHDAYGTRGAVAELEHEVARLLDKPAAVLFPSGTMAQLCALAVWAERTGRRTVAFHPTSHLQLHEDEAYAHLHGLVGRQLGDPRRIVGLADLEEVVEPLAALLLELPQREIGGQLPEWDDLLAQTAWARDRGVPLHLDGARLWEAAIGYAREPAEVAAPFDTVYVSFYKGLGAVSGACLAGPADVVAQVRLWRHRHGGNVYAMWPAAVSALAALRDRLPGLPARLVRARELAAGLVGVDGVEVVPRVPHVAMFHLHLRTTDEHVRATAARWARDEGLALPSSTSASVVPGWRVLEVNVGDPADDLGAAEAVQALASLVAPS